MLCVADATGVVVVAAAVVCHPDTMVVMLPATRIVEHEDNPFFDVVGTPHCYWWWLDYCYYCYAPKPPKPQPVTTFYYDPIAAVADTAAPSKPW